MTHSTTATLAPVSPEPEIPTPSPWRRWLGIGLILSAGIWFAGMFAVGFLPFSLEVRGGLALACFILMEVSFWLGTVIVGKQVVARWWRRWRGKPEPETEHNA